MKRKQERQQGRGRIHDDDDYKPRSSSGGRGWGEKNGRSSGRDARNARNARDERKGARGRVAQGRYGEDEQPEPPRRRGRPPLAEASAPVKPRRGRPPLIKPRPRGRPPGRPGRPPMVREEPRRVPAAAAGRVSVRGRKRRPAGRKKRSYTIRTPGAVIGRPRTNDRIIKLETELDALSRHVHGLITALHGRGLATGVAAAVPAEPEPLKRRRRVDSMSEHVEAELARQQQLPLPSPPQVQPVEPPPSSALPPQPQAQPPGETVHAQNGDGFPEPLERLDAHPPPLEPEQPPLEPQSPPPANDPYYGRQT
jgi:hypothetical protein